MPLIILLAMLLFIDHTHQYFKNTTYSFVYDTNRESVRKYATEIAVLGIDGYHTDDDHGNLFLNMVFAYNKALGEKYSIVSFLMDGNMNIYHGNSYNETFLSSFLGKSSNMELIKTAGTTRGNGDIVLAGDGWEETFYYHFFTDGTLEFYLFMSIDRTQIDTKLNADEILIPICIIGLLLLLLTEYVIWLWMTTTPSASITTDCSLPD
jgi:hypothetical protein